MDKINYVFSGIPDLIQYINQKKLYEFRNLLVEVFAEEDEYDILRSIIDVCYRHLPQATLVGCTPYGSASQGKPLKEAIRLSFTVQIDTEMNISEFAAKTSKQQKPQQTEKMIKIYKALFDHSLDLIYVIDKEGKFTEVNAHFLESTGLEERQLIGQDSLKYVNQKDVWRFKKRFLKAMQGHIQTYETSYEREKGKKQYYSIKELPIVIEGEVEGIVGIGRNITEQKRVGEQLSQLSYYDAQTNLPNRVKFSQVMHKMIQRSKKEKREMAVLLIDIDRFQIVNDSLGHHAGDLILKEIALRMQRVIPADGFMGRFAGDAFSLLLHGDVCIKNVNKVIKKIANAIGEPIVFNDKEFFMSASIGVSMFPNDGVSEGELLKNADIALNKLKNQGGNSYMFYCNEMNKQAIERLKLEGSLRKAVMNEEFHLCYQPLVDVKAGRIYGSEALIRWNHPEQGIISPADFIPLAEETGLIVEIGTWVLKKACKQNKEWLDAGFGELVISVNVSPLQFQQPLFYEIVKDALRESGLPPQLLHLELTENSMLENMEYSIGIMEKLRQMGVKVSIDDFGTGYSSLSYLKNLPIDYLKIDQSFINNLKEDSEDMAIVKAIIMMGRGLSLRVVAEGVETEKQLSLLKEMDCHFAQGYYIDKPLTVEEFEKKLNV
ncbi:sensor domain-containing protein [Bacillus testis]|uniref:sensor domain-containing protein n=1 Tax=Bacillus testis TaxID=1622072 RepID=UPI00067E974A|nr:bifunctional diguanylate cyclase/phosphodiesterase [Bacillus testis]